VIGGRARGAGLAAKALTVGYAGRTVIDAAIYPVAPGERLALVGPIGAGKSSLLRALTGVLGAPAAGSIDLLGEAVDQVPRKKLARTIAVVPELADPAIRDAGFEEVVALGRLPTSRRSPGSGRPMSRRSMARSKRIGITGLRRRDMRELSMGERQLVFIAVAGSRRLPRFSCWTSRRPISDIRHQVDVMELLVDLNERDGTTVIAVLHDLALAAHFFRVSSSSPTAGSSATAPPRETLSAERIREVFRCGSGARPPAGRSA
jgi:iron complex transport system ATP-binding protein